MILALRYRALWLALAVIGVVLVVTGSLAPAGIMSVFSLWDKAQHLLSYLALTLCWVGIVERRAYPGIAVAAVLLGGLLEVGQGYLTTSRMMDWHDLAANSLGVALGLIAAYAGLGGWARRVETWLGTR